MSRATSNTNLLRSGGTDSNEPSYRKSYTVSGFNDSGFQTSLASRNSKSSSNLHKYVKIDDTKPQGATHAPSNSLSSSNGFKQ
mmetsp:Transcript_26414/g.23345  ORF Transcript_26414/g.23345 Transcript_26414/m.23345 type:complete len:83 (-) Transcript_26414:481-729(-)